MNLFRVHLFVELFLIFCSTLTFGQAKQTWYVLFSKKLNSDEAIRTAITDLNKTGAPCGLEFQTRTDNSDINNNSIIVGAPERNKLTAQLQKQGKIKLTAQINPEGYEIVTTTIKGKKVIIIAGGSIQGDVYGLYWLWDRIRVSKKIPDINTLREPALEWRYTRIAVKNKQDIQRTLRYGLNTVYVQKLLDLVPWDSEPEKSENELNRRKVRELIQYAHSLHLKVFAFGTDFTYHPSILKEFGASLTPCDPSFWDALQAKYRRLLKALPELDGIATFTGPEQHFWVNYKTFNVMEEGEGCEWPYEKRYRTFVKKVHSVVSGEFNKVLLHRTWNTNEFEQQARPEVYKKIFTDDVPVKNLYLVPSFTQHDRWWHQRYNPTFNITPHNMMAVLEPMNYYEASSSNIFPTYPGIYFQAGLQSILEVKNSNLKGASFDFRTADDHRTFNLTAYTVYRLEWNYLEDPLQIATDFCSIYFGENVAEKMAEIYMLSPAAYKYGLFIEPVAYGHFNSLPHIRVGTFPAQGYPAIDNGKQHLEFWREIYLRCKPWLFETYMELDHGLDIANSMNEKYKAIKSQIKDTKRASEVENSLQMTRFLIQTNNTYVKTVFAYFAFRDNPTFGNRQQLATLFAQLNQTRQNFMDTPGFGYKLFGVDQILKNVKQALDDLQAAELLIANSPDVKEIELTIKEQQKKYAAILTEYAKEAVKIVHWEGQIDGRDILAIKGNTLNVEHLRWDPPTIKVQEQINALPDHAVTVIPKDIQSRPMHPFVLEQPTAKNNYTAKIYLYDVPGGRDWMNFDLYYIPKSPSELGLDIPWNNN